MQSVQALKPKPKVIAIIVVVALLVLVGIAGIRRVNPGEEGIVLTFGHMTDRKAPGLYFIVPLVQDMVTGSITNIHTMEYGFRTTSTTNRGMPNQYQDVSSESFMLAGDGNIVNVEAVCQYHISDLRDYLFEVEDQEDTMRMAFETVLRRNIQNLKLDDALLNKEQIEMQVLPDFQRALDSYRIGVKALSVRIQNISVPTEVSPAYEDVNNALNEKNRKLDEAEKYKNQVIPVARSNAYKLIQEAEGYRAETVATAQGDALRFLNVLKEYKNAPSITRDRLTIETLEKALSGAQYKVFADDSGVLKMLPISVPQTAEGGVTNGR